MREIKFRCFDLQNKKFVGGDILRDYVLGEMIDDISCEVSQFTGLKDKNGKEIYEGDIARIWEEESHVPNRDSGGGIIDFNRREGYSQLGVVGFKGAWYTYETKKHLKGRKEHIYGPLDLPSDIEIVGNIYENPELLEESK
ncbi:YopX family protein [Bacillus toyonensis]|uniref:YopX family protein n=1 Tax=Bacillus toyonensis TaxID=155322 RepID=UPI0027151F25|nr:YopX family protein [Bacillus toyonensis]